MTFVASRDSDEIGLSLLRARAIFVVNWKSLRRLIAHHMAMLIELPRNISETVPMTDMHVVAGFDSRLTNKNASSPVERPSTRFDTAVK